MKPNTRGFETGLWEFHNISNQFMISLSVRRDFIKELNNHFETHGNDWTTVPPATVGEYSMQYDRFIETVQNFIVDANLPPEVMLISSNGETWCCRESLVEICNDFDMGGFIHTPIINVQPTDENILVGSIVEFRISCMYAKSYEWFKSNNGSDWISTGVFNQPLKFATRLDDNGTFYRAKCVGRRVIYSNSVHLGVFSPLSITKNPVDKLLQPLNSIVKFDAMCDNSVLVQWEQKFAGTSSWIPSFADGSNTNEVSVVVGVIDNNSSFRARYESPVETKVTTPANLTIDFSKVLPRIVKQPYSITTQPNIPVTFTSQAALFDTVVWQEYIGANWIDIPNETTETLVVFAAPEKSGSLYRATYTNSDGSINSRIVSLTVLARTRPAITLQPIDVTVTAGLNAVFRANATDYDTVQWFVSTNNGTSWVESSAVGNTSNIISVEFVTVLDSNNLYRAVFTNAVGDSTTVSAKLTVVPPAPPTIAIHPRDTSTFVGRLTTLNSVALGVVTDIQWQVKLAGSSIWTDSREVGNKTPTLSILTPILSDNGNVYRVMYSNDDGSVTSAEATLSVTDSLNIIIQPVDAITTVGTPVSFVAKCVSPDAFTVQWYVYEDGATDWVKSTESGNRTEILTINNPQLVLHDSLYKAIYRYNGVYSKETSSATLLVLPSRPIITLHPSDVNANVGQNVVFTADADLFTTIQWETRESAGGAWVNSSSPGNTSKILTISNVTIANDNCEYRAAFTNLAGETTRTNVAFLTVNPNTPPVVTMQPINATAVVGETAMFTAESDSFSSVVWEEQAPTQAWVQSTRTGFNTSTLRMTLVSIDLNGYKFRVKFTNALGTTTSNEVTLTVLSGQPPAITRQPDDESVGVGLPIAFDAAGLEYDSIQWQEQTNARSIWVSSLRTGATTDTLVIDNATIDLDQKKFRAVFTNFKGSTVSREATLDVTTPPPTITVQPVDVYVAEFGNASFTIDGDFTSVVWYEAPLGGTWSLSNVNGQNTKTISLTDVRYVMHETAFKAVVTLYDKSVESNDCHLRINRLPPVVTVNPPAVAKCKVGFDTTITADGTSYDSVRWAELIGNVWTDVSYPGFDTKTLTINNVSVADEGKQLHCVFTNSGGGTSSTTCVVTVQPAGLPVITLQPTSIDDAVIGTTVQFNSLADNYDSIKWFKNDLTLPEVELIGQTSPSLSFVVDSTPLAIYYAEYKNRAGVQKTNNTSLTVDTSIPLITLQPSDTINVASRDSILYSDASNFKTIEWEFQNVGSVDWFAAPFSSKNSKNLTIYGLTELNSGMKFRVKYSNTNVFVYSNEITVTVIPNTVPKITTQPTSVTVIEPNSATLSVVGTNYLTVEWFDTVNGFVHNGSTYTFSTTQNMNGRQFFAKLSNLAGSIDSNTVTLTVDYPANVLTLNGEALTLNNVRLTN